MIVEVFRAPYQKDLEQQPPLTVLLKNEEENFIEEIELSKKQLEKLFPIGKTKAIWEIEKTMFGRIKFKRMVEGRK